jgi:bifunctional enzyme CysN/CysC
MGHQPMIKNKRYKLKLAGVRVPVWLKEIVNVLDASELTTDTNRRQIERHDVAECVLETLSPIAFDITQDIAQTGRFVIIDNYEIAGGGVVLDAAAASASRIDEHVKRRQQSWDRSNITQTGRGERYNQRATLVLITGPQNTGKKILAKSLEEDLFGSGRGVYYLGLSNTLLGDETNVGEAGERDEFMRRLGEVSHLFTDAGLILITTISDLEDHELEVIDKLNQPNDILVVNVGEKRFAKEKIDLQIEENSDTSDAIESVKQLLAKKNYLIEYYL